MDERGRSETLGYGVVTAGAVGFVVACFLPYFDPAAGGPPLSLWGLSTIEPSATETVASILILFAGPAVLIGISLVGLLRPRPWTAAAVIPTSIVWSLMWIGTLVSSSTRSNTDMAIAYLLMLACVGLVLIGTGAVFLSTRERPSSDATDGALRAGGAGNV